MPAGEAAAPELGQNPVPDDQRAEQVGELRLKPASDLDADLVLRGRHDEDHAVVRALLADAPGAPELVAEILDRIALQRVRGVDHELVAGLCLQALEVGLDGRLVRGREQVRLVDDPARQRREFRLGIGAGGE